MPLSFLWCILLCDNNKGAVLAPNKLAMGQSYEQLDKGEEGQLGKREF